MTDPWEVLEGVIDKAKMSHAAALSDIYYSVSNNNLKFLVVSKILEEEVLILNFKYY